MSPAFPESPSAQRNEDANGEHRRIALCRLGGLVEERADAGILFVDEIPE